MAAAIVAIGGAVAAGIRIGGARERRAVEALAIGLPQGPTAALATAHQLLDVSNHHDEEHSETRQLIIAVKDGDRQLMRELREGFTAEMRELRQLENRQNEILATAIGEIRGASDALRQAAASLQRSVR